MRELKVDFNVPEIDHHEFYYVEGKKIPKPDSGIRYMYIDRGGLLHCSKWEDDASEYGGAPLLGLKGLVVKSHGSAKSVEIRHAIFQCEQFKEEKINEKIEEFIAAEQKAQVEAKAEEK